MLSLGDSVIKSMAGQWSPVAISALTGSRGGSAALVVAAGLIPGVADAAQMGKAVNLLGPTRGALITHMKGRPSTPLDARSQAELAAAANAARNTTARAA